jgi:hypothetical protein
MNKSFASGMTVTASRLHAAVGNSSVIEIPAKSV